MFKNASVTYAYLLFPILLLNVFLWALNCQQKPKFRGVPPFKDRHEIGDILFNEGKMKGVELGVQQGKYASRILKKWKNCGEYVLVDLWKSQDNYLDLANIDNDKQEKNYQETLRRVEPYKDRTKIGVCRDYTTRCSHSYEDNYFDFVYVDARHDYKGVLIDMEMWWPKLKEDGLFCGHDFVTAEEVKWTHQDWSKNYDGTVDPQGRAVKGAVLEFADKVGRQITVSYREGNWNTWCIRK